MPESRDEVEDRFFWMSAAWVAMPDAGLAPVARTTTQRDQYRSNSRSRPSETTSCSSLRPSPRKRASFDARANLVRRQARTADEVRHGFFEKSSGPAKSARARSFFGQVPSAQTANTR